MIYVRNRDKETHMHSELAIEMGSEKFLIDGVPTLHSRQMFEKVCLLRNFLYSINREFLHDL